MANRPRKAKPLRMWEYQVTQPMLPPNADSPVMSNEQMEFWLADMDSGGWEFIGFGTKHWNEGFVQEWWIFRRPASSAS